MKTLFPQLSVAALGIALLAPPPALAEDVLPTKNGARTMHPTQFLVKYREGTHRSAVLQMMSQRNVIPGRQLPSGPMVVHVPVGQSVTKAIASFKDSPDVEYVQPNFIYHVNAVPDDPNYANQWGLSNTAQTIVASPGAVNPVASPATGAAGKDIGAEAAWEEITDCSAVPIAVIDTGINYNHVDLAPNVWDGGTEYPKHGYDFVDMDDDPIDLNGHGTHVAGIIAAAGDNAAGGSGVCWKASVMGIRVLDAAGSGDTVGIVAGLTFAVARGAKVVNMSLGGPGYDQAFEEAVADASARGVVVVVSAGNNTANNDLPGQAAYPCNFPSPNLLCVAALDQNYGLASFSNFGATSVDVGAPGVNIQSGWAGKLEETTSDFTDWTSDPVPSSGSPSVGWAHKLISVTGGNADGLTNPPNYAKGNSYASNADDKASKAFPLTGALAATVGFNFALDTESEADFVSIRCAKNGGDAFDGTSTQLDKGTGTTGASPSGGILAPYLEYDLSKCLPQPVIGFRLTSNATVQARGAAVFHFSIFSLTPSDSWFEVLRGTSQASPHVAGIAAMLMSYHPQYTAADVVAAIKGGGVPVASLSGKTVTGKAAHALGALSFIAAPTGVTVEKVP